MEYKVYYKKYKSDRAKTVIVISDNKKQAFNYARSFIKETYRIVKVIRL